MVDRTDMQSGRYKAYPEYKDSGVEWLKSIPKNWDRVAIKYLAISEDSLFIDGDWIESKSLSDSGIRYITTGNVGQGVYKEQGTGYISERTFKSLNCTEVFEGDLLISRLNPPIGRACIVPNLDSRIVTSVDNVILRPDNIYSKRFLTYLFSSKEYFSHTSNLARGATMQRISRSVLGNIRIPVPTKKEQLFIANFLDYETAKIDTLIEKQQRLIELLTEKRQAVISHAVTKGLNPDVPMKDSGVEWLGEVPAHWDINKLRYKFDFGSGLNITKANLKETGVPCINYGEIHSKYGFEVNTDVHQLKCVDELYLKARPGALLNQGDFIFADTSEDIEGAGNFTQLVSCSSAFAGYHTVIARPKDKFGIRFYAYLLDSVPLRTQIRTSVKGVKVFSITQSILKSINIWIPPLNEREEIAEYLDEQTYKIDALIAKATQQIQLMQERRTALISAAVTGKIDVRDWVKPE